VLKPNEKIGLYGGSFDPVHNGHLILARDALERLDLDRVIFIPARVSPHKLDHPPAPPEARCQMLVAAIADEPRFEMDPCEIAREGPSFAVETVQLFKTRYPQARLYYFVGDDNLPELETWKDFANLRDLVQFVVLSRAGMPFLSEFPTITRHIEISSTEIRNRVARGLSVRYLAPRPACELMARLRLYRDD
jgi:nicotinate-nucleotide adenylyltransferase